MVLETAERGLPIPRPSYNFLLASSRGERGISLEEDEWGLVGDELEPPDLEELVESASSSPSLVSMVTAGNGCDTAGLKRRGWGRALGAATASPGGGEIRSPGGGVTLTLGEVTARLALRTELFLSARLQDVAESDLDGTPVEFTLFEAGLPKEVPPLMTVVELGVGGIDTLSLSSLLYLDIGTVGTLGARLPNLPPNAAVIGSSPTTDGWGCCSFARRI